MPKISKNYIIIITLSVISLILGGTFFAISQNNSKQGSAQNSTNPSSVSNSSQISPTSQSSSSGFSSISSSNSQNSSSFSSSQANSSNTKIQPLVADSEYDVAVLEKYDIAIKYKKPIIDNQIIYIEPAGGGARPGITFQYEDGTEKGFNFSYYCFSDIGKGGTFNDKTERTFQEYLNGANDFEGKYTKLNTIPFFTSDSKERIKEVYENNSPFGNKGQKKLLYLFSNNNYCELEIRRELEIQHVNGQNLGLTETTLLKNVTLQPNSLAPSTPSVKLEQKPSFTGHGDINPITENPQTQTYTNEFYPDLNIKYDNSWKFSTTTTPNVDGLVNREITLTKNQTVLKFNLNIKINTGCAGGPDQISVATAGKHFRLKDDYQDSTYYYQSYSKGMLCGINYTIISNLPSKNYPKYSQQTEPFVESFVKVGVAGSNQQELLEADQIVANSSFGNPSK
jgi:hypothetical protein